MGLRYRLEGWLRWHPALAAEVEHMLDERARQAEGFMSLNTFLDLRAPLPPMGGFAMGADLGIELVTQIQAHRPELVVECGSGVSTIVTAYALERAGGGTLVSLEHDPEWVETTRERLALHGFPCGAVHVEVRHAPLRSVVLGREVFAWYDRESISNLNGIDLLTIDGPPDSVGPVARYPALPVLADHLSDDCVIVIDDAARRGETEMLRRWRREFPRFHSRELQVAGGGVLGSWS